MNLEDLISSRIKAANNLEELADSLEILLGGGFSVWEDGSLYEIRQLVDRVRGLRIEINPREHPPPHFHVRAAALHAVFSIQDCKHLSGAIGGHQENLVRWWYARSRDQLITIWNATRPSDCPVGPIRV